MDPDYFDWTDTELESVGDVAMMLNVMVRRLERAGAVVEAAYGICHGSTGVDGGVDEVDVPHIHAVFKFPPRSSGGGLTLLEISRALGIESRYVDKPKRGRYSYDNMLSYLIHAKESDSPRYSPDDVVTLVGRPYGKIFFERSEAWERGRIAKAKRTAKVDVEWIEDQVFQGRLTKRDILMNPDYRRAYGMAKARIDSMLEIQSEFKALMAGDAIDNGEYRHTFVFIQGTETGAGKTSLAKRLNRRISLWSRERFGYPWEVYCGATVNPLDGYAGEEVVFLDDVRGKSMAPEDWLRLVDPYSRNVANARYRNRVMANRVTIVTSVEDPITFFERSKGTRNRHFEPVDQFLRRIGIVIRAYRVDGAGVDPSVRNYEVMDIRPLPDGEVVPVEVKVDGPGSSAMVRTEDVHYEFIGIGHGGGLYTMDEAIVDVMAVIEENNPVSVVETV